jgi:hypothetical protein
MMRVTVVPDSGTDELAGITMLFAAHEGELVDTLSPSHPELVGLRLLVVVPN